MPIKTSANQYKARSRQEKRLRGNSLGAFSVEVLD